MPPTPGTQSGTVIRNDIELILLINPLIIPITALKAVIPSHAFFQFPVKLPVIRSISPLSTFFTPPTVLPAAPKNPFRTFPNMPKLFDQSFSNIPVRKLSNGSSMLFQINPNTDSTISPIPCQHFPKSPVKAPVQKSRNPPRIFVAPVITSPTTPNKSRIMPPSTAIIGPRIGMIFSTIQSMNGTIRFSHNACRFSNTFPNNSRIPLRAGCICSDHTVLNLSAK